MFLQTDEQTIGDLRIFGKRDAAGIYDLYNHTHTRGAEALLEAMFRAPLSDRKEIARRSAVIEGFTKIETGFPFDPALFDMAEKFLKTADEQKKQHNQQSLLSEKEIANGVAALIELVQRTKQFVESPELAAMKDLAPERSAMAELLADPALQPVLQEQAKGKLSYAAITAYDLLFRVRVKQKLEALLQQLYFLDVCMSVASVARKRGFVFPKAMEKGKMHLLLKGLYHPQLQHPVGNDFTMSSNRNLIFLTGANMAGKSTFLRAVSTALYLAHMGFPVAASKMEFSVMDAIYTTINLPDNLGIGASHFYAEVLRVKKVAAELNAGKSVFVIFDELFRGTNVKDAHEATTEISMAFAERKNSLFIISSHIVEAGVELQKVPTIGFQFLPTRMKGHVPEYTYTLEEGITEDRHGMIIIRNEGVLDILKHGRKKAVLQQA